MGSFSLNAEKLTMHIFIRNLTKLTKKIKNISQIY